MLNRNVVVKCKKKRGGGGAKPSRADGSGEKRTECPNAALPAGRPGSTETGAARGCGRAAVGSGTEQRQLHQPWLYEPEAQECGTEVPDVSMDENAERRRSFVCSTHGNKKTPREKDGKVSAPEP